MNKLIKISIIAGFLAHLWTNVSWMMLPLHQASIKSFTDDAQVQLALLKGIESNERAVYALPAMHSGEKHSGPTAFIALTPTGQVFSWKKLVFDLFNNILAAFLLAWLLMKANLSGYADKLKFSAAAGLLVAVLSLLPNINWWGFAVDYAAVMSLDLLITSLIVGLVFAKFTEK